MKENEKAIFEPSERMDGMQDVVYMVEAFLSENYRFRRNILSGKTELAPARCRKGHEPKWKPVTAEEVNSIVRRAKKACVGGKRSPKVEIEEYIYSNDIPAFNPIREYLASLPEWDGRNHVADLFGRIPDITTEQLSWCSVWMRSMVAHWMGMDLLHGNECVPVLIGPQGCGKSTFAVRLLPEQLRSYFLDHINFGNKFDSEMALTHPSSAGCRRTGFAMRVSWLRPTTFIRFAIRRAAADTSVCASGTGCSSTIIHPSTTLSSMHR